MRLTPYLLLLALSCSVVILAISAHPAAANQDLFSAIKDSALKNCLRKDANKHNWQQANHVTKIKCHGKKINSLQGIEQFTELTYLSLFNNNIANADLTPLSKLEYLNLASNRLSSLQVAGLSQLSTLYLFKNKLKSLDMSGLAQVKKLRLTNNLLTELDIQPLLALEKAYLFDNKLEDLTVKGLTKLTLIDLKQNPMPDEVYDRYDQIDGITIIHDGNAEDWQ